MKMSTKGRYGLRLMLDIAVYGAQAPVTLKDVANRQEISEKYLEQIMIRLSKSGMVRGMRGARGGYMLTRRPEDITVGEILRTVEGGLGPVDCVNCDETGIPACKRADSCITIGLWRDMKAALESVVDHRTLDQMVVEYRMRLERGESCKVPCEEMRAKKRTET